MEIYNISFQKNNEEKSMIHNQQHSLHVPMTTLKVHIKKMRIFIKVIIISIVLVAGPFMDRSRCHHRRVHDHDDKLDILCFHATTSRYNANEKNACKSYFDFLFELRHNDPNVFLENRLDRKVQSQTMTCEYKKNRSQDSFPHYKNPDSPHNTYI